MVSEYSVFFKATQNVISLKCFKCGFLQWLFLFVKTNRGIQRVAGTVRQVHSGRARRPGGRAWWEADTSREEGRRMGAHGLRLFMWDLIMAPRGTGLAAPSMCKDTVCLF